MRYTTDTLEDDPELFTNQPVCLQVVGRPFQDEEAVAVAEVFDGVINPPTWTLL